MSGYHATSDLTAISSMRSALSHALECLDHLSLPHDELEQLIEKALQLSSRKERECMLMRRLSFYRAGVNMAETGSQIDLYTKFQSDQTGQGSGS